MCDKDKVVSVPWRSEGIAQISLTSATRWRRVIKYTPLPLYTSRGKSPAYSLNRRQGGPQIPSGLCGEEKILELIEIEPGPSSP
jgi:hypothetical protein